MACAGLRRIGLTGGIGSGKSTVAAMLVDHGATLVDTDAIARALTACGGAAIGALRAEFGDAMIDADGALDRARMRTLAFGDPAARQRLESILHPMIGAETLRLEQAAPPDGCIVFDVPLLAESSRWRARVDRVLVVDCEESTQARRVALRNGWEPGAAQRVIAQQATRAQRRRCADAVIYNDGLTLDALTLEVQALWRRWCGGVA